MTTYRVQFSESAQRQVRRLDPQIRRLIIDAASLLGEDPHPAASRRLISDVKEYRLRVRDYRIVYEVDDGILLVTVVRVGHRGTVYRRQR